MDFENINIDSYLKSHDIKISYQRTQIFKYLIKYKNHPTVDIIYKGLIKNIPSLSKTTIYNTLKLFVDKKIVSVINIEDNETRYDADTSFHGHFKCKKCNKIYDIRLEKPTLIDFDNYIVDEYHFYLKGICSECNKTKN